MKLKRQTIKGFTLLEMLLVLAISSSMLVLLLNYTTQKSDETRRDKTVLQMQQILNAALSYYVNTATWPVKTNSPECASTTGITMTAVGNKLVPNYIPTNMTNMYGSGDFTINCTTIAPNNSAGAFYVYTQVNTAANGTIIAGKLPMAFLTDNTGATAFPPVQTAACKTATPDPTCTYVVTFITIPGQNLNNARSVNYAGTYSPSACVPAPVCPANMRPSILVMPTGVSGVYDAPTPTSCSGSGCSANVYPISSFTAWAVGGQVVPVTGWTGNPVQPGNPASGDGSGGPYDCSLTVPNNMMPCLKAQGSNAQLDTSVNYWRVCLSVVTEKGQVVIKNTNSNAPTWGTMSGSIVAFTRCVPNNGAVTPVGTPFNVWQKNVGYNP